MGGVPEQRHPTERQAVRYRTVVEVVAQDGLLVASMSPGTGAPTLEESEQLGFSVRPRRESPCGARGVPVDAPARLCTPNREPWPQDSPPGAGRRAGRRPRDSTPRLEAREPRRTVCEGHGSDDGVQTVGTDGNVHCSVLAVGELESYAVAVLLEGDAPAVEAEGVLAEGLSRTRGGPLGGP